MKVKSSTSLDSSGKKGPKRSVVPVAKKEAPKKKPSAPQTVVEPAAAVQDAKVKKGKATAVVRSPLKAAKVEKTKKGGEAKADKKRKEVAFESEEDEELDGFESSEAGYDSSDEEGQVQAEVSDLPKPKKVEPKKADVRHSARCALGARPDGRAQPKPKRGVVYLGHLPSSFPEASLRSYLTQFGTVTRLRISRSRRTGRPKGYAFVEFEHREVAEVVCETMDGYLLAGRLLKCEMVDPSKVHRRLWEGSGKRFRKDEKPRLAREKHNAVRRIPFVG